MWLVWTFVIFVGLALILSVVLGVVYKYCAVKEDKRVEMINKMLPGYNCGVCAKPGCLQFAVAILNNEVASLSVCKPGKKDKHFLPILEYLKENPNDDGSIVQVSL